MDKNIFIKSLNILREHMKENFNDWNEDDEEVYRECLNLVNENEDLKNENSTLNSNLADIKAELNKIEENVKELERKLAIDPFDYGDWIYQRGEDSISPHHSYVCPRCRKTSMIKENVCPRCGLIMNKEEHLKYRKKI